MDKSQTIEDRLSRLETFANNASLIESEQVRMRTAIILGVLSFLTGLGFASVMWVAIIQSRHLC